MVKKWGTAYQMYAERVPRWRATSLTSRTAVYGPVRTVVWQGAAGNCRPYADQTGYPSMFRKGSPTGPAVCGVGMTAEDDAWAEAARSGDDSCDFAVVGRCR